MYSFSFPNMLNQTTAALLADKEAIRSNMYLLVSSERNTLFGDPYYGCLFRKYLFEQSERIVKDLLIDHIYTAIVTFMPQVTVRRKDISVYVEKTTLFVSIKYTYLPDNTSDLYTISLNENLK